MQNSREHWGNKIGFILAAAGSAVGLGNIWKFPYITGENGGAAFIIVYLLCIMLIGFPVLIAEILLGRYSQKGPISTFRNLAEKNKKIWMAGGLLFFISGFIILSYYNVIAGWSLGYVIESINGHIRGLSSSADASAHFAKLVSNPFWTLSWLFAFVAAAALIVYFGVRKGIERISLLLMPIFFVILVFLAIWGICLDCEGRGLAFLFRPDWSTITFSTVLIALGHAFFTLSLGMGVLLTYGSYLEKNTNLFFSGSMIVLLDTLIALIAGLAIFTSVFGMGFDPAEGPGLVFHVLPAVFASMPGGWIFSLLFFVLLSIAALTSTISILEMMVSTLLDETRFSRQKIVVGLSLLIFFMGIPAAMSFAAWDHIRLFNLTIFDLMDYLAANIFLPFGGLLIAIFVGWVLKRSVVIKEFQIGSKESNILNRSGDAWYFLLKYLAPVLIILVFLSVTGIL